MMRRKIFLIALLIAIFGYAQAKTIYVPDDYAEIQWAIDNASVGDTIIVRDGTYNLTYGLYVNKPLTIKSENGSAKCIIKGYDYWYTIELKADGIRIEGFTIIGEHSSKVIAIYSDNNVILENKIIGRAYTNYGIHLWYSENNTISRNNISNTGTGIYLYHSENNIISENIINPHGSDIGYGGIGIEMWYSENNIISRNNILNCYKSIFLSYSNSNTISKNIMERGGVEVCDSYNNKVCDNIINGKPLVYLENVSDISVDDAGQVVLVNCENITLRNLNISNAIVGIQLWKTNHSTISGNNISNNHNGGIRLWYSNNNVISENMVQNNPGTGIELHHSGNNVISENDISNNGYGIDLDNSDGNVILKNGMSNSPMYLWYSNNNVIYLNNFIKSSKPEVWFSSNIWNSTEKNRIHIQRLDIRKLHG